MSDPTANVVIDRPETADGILPRLKDVHHASRRAGVYAADPRRRRPV